MVLHLIAFLATVHVSMATQLHCELDGRINSSTWNENLPAIRMFLDKTCERNRGVFVLNPPDGHSYSCSHFPATWNITTSAKLLTTTNTTAAVSALQQYITSVYMSTPEYIRLTDPLACASYGIATLMCGQEDAYRQTKWSHQLHNQPIRSVTLGGLFVLKKWILPDLLNLASITETPIVDDDTDDVLLSFSLACSSTHICDRIFTHWATFYTLEDFSRMYTLGLNCVRIPISYAYFNELLHIQSLHLTPKQSIFDPDHPLTKTILLAQTVGIQVILNLVSISESSMHAAGIHGGKYESVEVLTVEACKAVCTYVHKLTTMGVHNVILFQVESHHNRRIFDTVDRTLEFIHSIRAIASSLSLLLPSYTIIPPSALGGDKNVFISTSLLFDDTIADIASDTAQSDREKLFVHESEACGLTAHLHFTTCTKTPTLISEFSLAIEDCLSYSPKQYGQCAHIQERNSSDWWRRHYQSFGMRQMETYEKELGWSFSYWKLGSLIERSHPYGVYWSFSLAAEKGLITGSASVNNSSTRACTTPPEADYSLGDSTMLPTYSANDIVDTPDDDHIDLPATYTDSKTSKHRIFLYFCLFSLLFLGGVFLQQWYQRLAERVYTPID